MAIETRYRKNFRSERHESVPFAPRGLRDRRSSLMDLQLISLVNVAISLDDGKDNRCIFLINPFVFRGTRVSDFFIPVRTGIKKIY